MNTENRIKINKLVQQWPRGTASTTSALFSIGFGNELLHSYKNSHWIQPLGRGAYALVGDRVEWSGGVYAFQNQLGHTVHPEVRQNKPGSKARAVTSSARTGTNRTAVVKAKQNS